MSKTVKIDEVQSSQIEKIEGSLAYIQAIIHAIKKTKEYSLIKKTKNVISDAELIKKEALAIKDIMNLWIKKEK